jgi:hypothetical protein
MLRTGWLIVLALILPAIWGYAVHQALWLAWPARMRQHRGESGPPDADSALNPWDYQI